MVRQGWFYRQRRAKESRNKTRESFQRDFSYKVRTGKQNHRNITEWLTLGFCTSLFLRIRVRVFAVMLTEMPFEGRRPCYPS